MALVLRKTFATKHVYLLKWSKGRYFGSTGIHKKILATTSAGLTRKNIKYHVHTMTGWPRVMREMPAIVKKRTTIRRETALLRSVSCPHLITRGACKNVNQLMRTRSAVGFCNKHKRFQPLMHFCSAPLSPITLLKAAAAAPPSPQARNVDENTNQSQVSQMPNAQGGAQQDPNICNYGGCVPVCPPGDLGLSCCGCPCGPCAPCGPCGPCRPCGPCGCCGPSCGCGCGPCGCGCGPCGYGCCGPCGCGCCGPCGCGCGCGPCGCGCGPCGCGCCGPCGCGCCGPCGCGCGCGPCGCGGCGCGCCGPCGCCCGPCKLKPAPKK